MKTARLILILFCLSIFMSSIVCAEETQTTEPKKPKKAVSAPEYWGLAMGMRYASIPYTTDDASGVTDVMPLFFYKKKYFFLDGLTGGMNFPLNEKWEIAALARFRFFDIPSEYQNNIQGYAVDYGARVRYNINKKWQTDLELFTDQRGLASVNGWLHYRWFSSRWDLHPFAKLRWKSSGFNNRYYGLNQETPGSAFDLTVGLDAKYKVWSNIHLVARAAITRFDKNTYDTPVMDSPTQLETFFGLGSFSDKARPVSKLKGKRYVRLAYGRGVVSSIGDVLTFNAEPDPYDSKMTSFFYGHPLSDTLFTLKIPVYLTGGLVWHHKNDVQPNSQEYVMAVKFYYTIPLPWRFRLGFAEGLSFASPVPNMEQREMDNKEYRASSLLNYLDFSFDLNLGDIFHAESIKGLWLGYSIHHRSGIFTTSSALGRIKGGSNYQTAYLQYHF